MPSVGQLLLFLYLVAFSTFFIVLPSGSSWRKVRLVMFRLQKRSLRDIKYTRPRKCTLEKGDDLWSVAADAAHRKEKRILSLFAGSERVFFCSYRATRKGPQGSIHPSRGTNYLPTRHRNRYSPLKKKHFSRLASTFLNVSTERAHLLLDTRDAQSRAANLRRPSHWIKSRCWIKLQDFDTCFLIFAFISEGNL